jgi:xanthine dehydrogenase accessory factor
MTCQGEGGIEIYLEPVLAAPRLVLLGHTPVVQSLARLGAELGFEVVVGSAAVSPDLFPPGVRVTTETATALAGADASTSVVVGTMGAGDEAALAAAASSDAPYIGLVASRKKGRYLIDFVRAEGVPAERLDRVKFPAGLDLGGMSASEIALSILAEIVHRRYAKPNAEAQPAAPGSPMPLARAGGSRPAAPTMARDPICGMPVDTTTARHTIIEGHRTIYFCCPGCRATYLRRQTESTT